MSKYHYINTISVNRYHGNGNVNARAQGRFPAVRSCVVKGLHKTSVAYLINRTNNATISLQEIGVLIVVIFFLVLLSFKEIISMLLSYS